MNVLVACERSGVVRDAFRARGHNAWSADLVPAEGHHIQGDVLAVLNDGWDLMIGHPPCTHLAVSGAKHFKYKAEVQAEALEFVRVLMAAPIEKICIENPVSVISSHIRPPDQIIHPWQFGHPESKTTCLWLKGLPRLQPTNVLGNLLWQPALIPEGKAHVHGWQGLRWRNQSPCGANNLPPSPERAMLRARTYEGVAAAMAAQWL